MNHSEDDLPPTTVVIPTLNEAEYIGITISQIMSEAPACLLEIIVADGGSTDGTQEIVSQIARNDPRVRMIHNPRRIQSAGINAAVREADPRAKIIVRVDAHSGYDRSFVCNVVSEMVRLQVDSIVVRLRTAGLSCFQKAVAAVSNSLSGTGGSNHRMGRNSGFVEHGHHAGIRVERFLALGGYDESFVANEDAEFDYRLCRAGGRIWLAADIVIQYYPRATPHALARQYFRYGWGRAQNVLKHRQRLRLRQMLPPLLVAYLLVMPFALAFLPNLLATLTLVPFVIYTILIAVSTFTAYRQNRSYCIMVAALVLPIMHCAWGLGFLLKLILNNAARFMNQKIRTSRAGSA